MPQWLEFKRLTHVFPEQDEEGVDLTLLRQNLRLTPEQRLERLQAGVAFLNELRNARRT